MHRREWLVVRSAQPATVPFPAVLNDAGPDPALSLSRIEVFVPNVSRVYAYEHLTERDLIPPTSPRVFFEPADTEIGVWVARDLITDGCSVLDLGSGSGAAAAAMARAGAGRVHGVDAGAETIAWATEHYASREGDSRVTFAQADFVRLSANDLLATAPLPLPPPLVVTSNPPYVPLAAQAGALRHSISGGTDGLRLAPAIIGHASALCCDLGLTIGSYSSPSKAVRLLESAGYWIHAVTLCPLPLGEFTLRNMAQTLALEERGEAVLWKATQDTPSYFIVGLACRWMDMAGRTARSTQGSDGVRPPERLTGEGLLHLLQTAARSHTVELEALEALDGLAGLSSDGWSGPLRILVLPGATARHHW
jgi:release factor glutamine methyltransferase